MLTSESLNFNRLGSFAIWVLLFGEAPEMVEEAKQMLVGGLAS